MEVVSRIPNSEIAYKGEFELGELIKETPTYGEFGTTITVKDLFYNNKQRKESLNPKEEIDLILNVI